MTSLSFFGFLGLHPPTWWTSPLIYRGVIFEPVPKINTICGGVFNAANAQAGIDTICSFSTPFRISVHFDADEVLGDTDTGNVWDNMENRTPADGIAGFGTQGFQLAYWQNTC